MQSLIPPDPPLELVLVSPEIPPNTGNVARLCAVTGAKLHLVAPLGFSLTDKDLRRAGLDYWSSVHAQTWESFAAFEEARLQGEDRQRAWFFAANAAHSHLQAEFAPGAILIFGRESRGLPKEILERYRDRTAGLPMLEGRRSLNLSTAAGIAVYEALRQIGAFVA